MTELELREKVAGIVRAWNGGAKGGPEHCDILNVYNSDTPLPRGYAVKLTDAYCATTASAAWIRAGVAQYTGKECSCAMLIEIAKQKGIWVEDDAHIPQVGDAVLYDWQDTGKGDNRGAPDHIGIVTEIDTDKRLFYATEGNIRGGSIGRRTMMFNGQYIRGFICPDYAAIAKELTAAEDAAKAKAAPVEYDLEEQAVKLYKKNSAAQNNGGSSYSEAARTWAVENGLIVGSSKTADGEPDYMWGATPTREQLVMVLYRFAQLIGKACDGDSCKI